jgi:hypothetical protein
MTVIDVPEVSVLYRTSSEDGSYRWHLPGLCCPFWRYHPKALTTYKNSMERRHGQS